MQVNTSHTNKGGLRKRMHRLVNRETGMYLHLSGAGEVSDANYAWCGFLYQARNLRDAATDGWPYKAVRREEEVRANA